MITAKEEFVSLVREFEIQLIREKLSQLTEEQKNLFLKLCQLESATEEQLINYYGLCVEIIKENRQKERKMEYNKCETCGADNGRAGDLISHEGGPFECLNCNQTRLKGEIVLHSHLKRTDLEVEKTIGILNSVDKKEKCSCG